MKKRILLKSMLLLCALVVGSNSLWAGSNVSTVTNKFSAAGTVTTNFTQTGDFKSAAWNLAVTWKSSTSWQNLDGTKGAQVGSGSNPATSIVLTGSGISGTITSVVVNTSGASSINATVGVSVGGTEFKNDGNSTASLTSSAADYTFTGSASGNVVITWTNSSSKAIYIKSITTTYSSGAQTTTTIDASGITNTDVYVGTSAGTLTANVKKKSDESAVDGATVTWSSNNTAVATIGESTGVVTLVATGDVTFTATYAGNSDYAGSEGTYDMTVTTSAPVSTFTQVADASTLKAGQKLLIVCTGQSQVMGTINSTYHNPIETTIGSILVTDGTDGYAILTLGGEEGAWTLRSSITGNYLSLGSYNNYLEESETATADAQKWSIAIDGDGNAKIINVAYPQKGSTDDTERFLQYNSGSPRFACYVDGQKDVQIYRETKSLSTSSGRNYASSVTAEKLDFSAVSGSITAYIASGLNSAGDAVVLQSVDVVPVSTPIIVKTSTQGATVNVPVTTADADDVTANKLVAGDGTTDWNGTANTTYYYLASDQFHQATSGTLQSGKAYLAVSTAAARDLSIVFDSETTGIQSVNSDKKSLLDGNFYNLAGQRVAQPQKGLYIVNGKKVVIK